jgi:ribosome-binding protein aMBF1 (putative translation factor)
MNTTTKKEFAAHLNQKSGHSRRLRAVLKSARERQGVSARALAGFIARRKTEIQREIEPDAVEETPHHENTIYGWERFEYHPNIVDFAAWARVLGFRLVVDLDDAEDGRTMVLLSTREAVEAARAVDMMPDEKRSLVIGLIRGLQSGYREHFHSDTVDALEDPW